MAWTFDNALEDDDITVIERDDSRGDYAIQVGELETIVTIELRRTLDGKYVEFRTSHAIKTPTQAGPYRTSRPFDDEAPYALHRAVDGITNFYRQAVNDGHTPVESWLVRND